MTFEDALKRLNPQQREAVEYVNGYLLVNAGAGSGKTSMLVARTANMVQNYGIAPSSILLVTFTNRAANEMKQRITHLIPDAGHITAWFDDTLMIAEFPISKGSTQWAPRLVYGLCYHGMSKEGMCFVDAHTGRLLLTWPNYVD